MNDLYKEFLSRLEKSNDSNRKHTTEKRHAKGFRTARIIHMVLYYKIVTEKNPSPRSLFWAIGFITNIYLLIDLGIHLIIKL